jgi:anti-anti-sigma factor
VLRISTIQSSGDPVTLRVEGEVKGLWVAELRRVCEEALAREVRLSLDLAGVSFIDAAGINLIRALRERRVLLANPSSFISEQIGGSES